MRPIRATARRARRWCRCSASRRPPTRSLRAPVIPARREVSVFGIPAATNTLTSRLAGITGAAVLPYFLQRLPGTQGYRAIIHPPLENFPSDCPAADTERFNRMIEAQVRAAPEQYLWIHRRFKGLSQDYPDYYGQRAQRRA